MPIYVGRHLFPILSRYKIPLEEKSVLGAGGMGVVFKAHDELLNKTVAIKTINPSFINVNRDSQNIEELLFFREAMTHARIGILNPEYILKVNNYGIEDDTPFMEMEILSGGSLRDRFNKIKENRRRGMLFDEEIIKDISLQICKGLKVLHSHKVFHSDLKPENILFLEPDKTSLKIADLGLARIAESGFLTKAGIATFFGGTRNYTPQLVVEGSQKPSARTDIYSLGVIIYEMIIGEPLQWSQAKVEFVERHAELSPTAKDLIKRACQLMGRNNFSKIEDFEVKIESLKVKV